MEKKCLTCRFNGEEFDGEAIPRYDGGYDGGGQWVGVCDKSQIKHYKEGGINCKKYDSIKSKCSGCNKVFSITELSQGFHSEECKLDFIERVKKSVVNDGKRLIEIQNRLKELEPINNLPANVIEWMELKGELQGVEHYFEEGKDILTRFGVPRI
jgi:hypothetical protein